jgi:hypothetical protein
LLAGWSAAAKYHISDKVFPPPRAVINATQEFYIPDPVTQFPAAIRGFLKELATVADQQSSSTATAEEHEDFAVVLETVAGEPVVGVETVLLAGPAGAVVTVLNWGGVPLDSALTLSLTLPSAGDVFGTPPAIGRVLDAWSGKALDAKIATASGNATTTASVQILARHANFITFSKIQAAMGDNKADRRPTARTTVE